MTNRKLYLHLTRLTVVGVAAIALTACSSAPIKDPGASRARQALTELQSNPDLASRAPVAIKEAEEAVRAAESPDFEDAANARQAAYLAEQKVDIAKTQAQKRYDEDQLKTLGEERERARLDARTREADQAKTQADIARAQAEISMSQAEKARAETEELKRQMQELNAKQTDRGLVLTLGDVLFETGRADLKPGATANLSKLVSFLTKYPDRSVAIEGHTDSVGGEDYNLGLSQRRADAVRAWLVGQGVGSERVTALGKGKGSPVASNETASGRQQNRRVEIIIAGGA